MYKLRCRLRQSSAWEEPKTVGGSFVRLRTALLVARGMAPAWYALKVESPMGETLLLIEGTDVKSVLGLEKV